MVELPTRHGTELQSTPPGPKGTPLVGNLLAFAESPLQFLSDCAQTYGDVVRLSASNYLVINPADVSTVLADREGIFAKQPGAAGRSGSRSSFPRAMMNSEGELWRRKRQWVQGAFQRERAHAWAPAIVEAAERCVAAWQAGSTRDLLADMLELTLTNIGLILFSGPVGDARVVEQAAAAIMERTRSPVRVPEWWPSASNRRFKAALGRFHGLLERLIAQRGASPGQHEDVLAHLLRQKSGFLPEPEDLRHEIATLLLSGHETTADALGWMWYLLDQHPHARARLEAELAEVLGDRPATPADLGQLSYAEALIKESLRLFPPAWATSRVAMRATRLGGYPVPAGTLIGLSAWVTQRDPRWFADPLAFRPERWLDGSLKDMPRGAYFPLGAGARVCIGAGLVQMEMLLILATLARRVRLVLAPGQRVTPFPALVLRPDGLRMQVQPM